MTGDGLRIEETRFKTVAEQSVGVVRGKRQGGQGGGEGVVQKAAEVGRVVGVHAHPQAGRGSAASGTWATEFARVAAADAEWASLVDGVVAPDGLSLRGGEAAPGQGGDRIALFLKHRSGDWSRTPQASEPLGVNR